MNECSGGMSRRTFLALSASVVVGACSSGDDDATAPTNTSPTTNASPPTTDLAATTAAPTSTNPPPTTPLPADPFGLGVSSGDPDENSAVLWTRLVGDRLPAAVDVKWELAADDTFDVIATSGTVAAVAADGHSVHVTVELDGPAFYRFRAGGFTSRTGRVAPTPSADDPSPTLRIATASCQHFETGYYAAHRDIAEWAPDLVMFLGDFIYEYAASPLGGPTIRVHEGAEVTDLASYRGRYAHYLSDPDLQAARAACPWLTIWDDHEVDNNYASLTPERPQDETTFAERRTAAYRAWWEHMPVRLAPPIDGADYPIYHEVHWGTLADMVMLDGRQYRSDQACGDVALSFDPACPQAGQRRRTMLGADQEQWLGDALSASTATWAVIGQQTVLTNVQLGEAVLNYDQWDGYGPARQRLLAQAGEVDRLVVLTGDIHLAGVGVLPEVGVEFVTTSISSSGLEEAGIEDALISFEDIVDAELLHRGYTRHTVTAETWTAEYRIVDDVTTRDSRVRSWKRFRVDAARRDAVAVV